MDGERPITTTIEGGRAVITPTGAAGANGANGAAGAKVMTPRSGRVPARRRV